jgi:hypothetical protein
MEAKRVMRFNAIRIKKEIFVGEIFCLIVGPNPLVWRRGF